MWLGMRNHTAGIHKVLSLALKNTDDSMKEMYKVLMRSMHIERKNDDSEDIMEQWINFTNSNYALEDSIPEFEKEANQILDICKLKEADSYAIDFANDEGKLK